jgi:hypothetical protein
MSFVSGLALGLFVGIFVGFVGAALFHVARRENSYSGVEDSRRDSNVALGF